MVAAQQGAVIDTEEKRRSSSRKGRVIMGEFFKPWRRRIGVVTLLMALVFMGGWLRSHSFVDYVVFPGKIFPKGNSIFSCASSDRGLECQRLWGDSDASNFRG